MGRYTSEFKEEACKLATEPDSNPASAAKRLGIPEMTLRVWLEKRGLLARQQREVPGTDDPAVLKIQIRELQKKLRDAQIDNEILKKATAFFARESK